MGFENCSGFRNKDALFVLLLFFYFLLSFRQIFNMFKDLYLESTNIQTQNCEPIQCTVWPRSNDIFSKSVNFERKITRTNNV